MRPALKEAVPADAPQIPHRGTYGIPNLRDGPKIQAVLDDLVNPRFRKLVEAKFGIDLAPYHRTIVVMGNTSGHCARQIVGLLPRKLRRGGA